MKGRKNYYQRPKIPKNGHKTTERWAARASLAAQNPYRTENELAKLAS
jgi:hypothetical protein